MVKKLFKVPTFLVCLMLMYQLVFPVGNVMVSASTSMLPPSNLAYQTITPDDGKLTWSAVFGATGYKVYEIKEGQLVVLGTSTTASYSLNDLPEGSYQYVVSTLSSEGESGPSAPVRVEIVYPNMEAPATLTSTIQNGNDVVLSWEASQYAEKYNVYQIAETGEKTLLTNTAARTYTIANSDEGTFTYTVSAFHPLYGESPDAAPVQAEVVHPVMKQPENLSFTITNGTDVTLKWQAVDYATSYKIYEVKDGQLNLKSTVTGTSVKYTNVPAGDYTYKVFSYSNRFGESAEGSPVSLTVSSIVMTSPSNLIYKIQNINDVVLSWGAVPYATGYKVYQLVNGERILKSTVTGTSVTYTMLPGGNYEYEIHSYSDRYGDSEAGARVSFSIETVTIYPPTNLTYKIQNGNDIVLNWNASDNATNFNVYQIIDGQKILKTTVSGTTVTFTNMPAGNYQFEVYTTSARFGESQEAAQVSLTLEPIFLSEPSNATYEIKNGNDLILKWNPVENADYYKLYQVINGQKVFKAYIWTGTTATFTNLAEGYYQYVIHAYSNRFGESEKGGIVNVSVVHPEIISPGNVVATINSPSSFTLKWDAADYAAYYEIYQIIDGKKVFINNVFGTTITFNNMKPGLYHYEVYSYSIKFGKSLGGTSVEVELDGQVLSAPANLSYSIINGNDLNLKWDPITFATGYKIYQIVDGEAVLKRTVYSTYTTFTNLPEGEFNYVIKAYSTLFGESENGAEVKGFIDFPVLAKPQNLANSISNGNDIILRWNPVTYATAYKIYQIVEGEKVLMSTVAGTATTFTNMPAGDYNYEVHSYSDRFGESPEGSQTAITVVFPIMQAPGNFAYSILNGNDIALRWNPSPYATSYKIYQIVDGEKVLKRTIYGTATSFINMSEDDYNFVVHAYSDRFGESPEPSKVEFTLGFPTMQAPVYPAKSITNGNDIKLSWSPSAYANEYRIYQIMEGEKVLKRTVYSTTTTFTNMPEGDYRYVVHAYSTRFGESPVGSELEFNLTWPIVQAPALQGSVFNANNMTLSWPSVTWANEYRVYKVNGETKELLYKGPALSYKVYNLTEDTHSFEVTAYSTRFGESVASNRLQQAIVYPIMGVPTPTLKLLSDTSARISWDFITYANGYNIYEIIDGKPVLVAEKVNNLSYTIQNLTYTNHLYHVTSYSNSFGESKPSETVLAKLIIDTTAPETKDNAPVQWENQNQTVSLTATDDETGVAKTFYSLNDGMITEGTSILVDREGINKISYNSVDKVGNVEQVKTTFVKIDKTAPKTYINDIPPYAQSFTVELTAEDNLSGVAETYYSINGSEYVEGTSFVIDQEGINEISYYSVDAAGNKEEVKTVKINIDKTAPVTTADVPETWVNNDVSVTLTPADENSSVAKTYYSFNGSDFVEGTNLVVDREGINNISYYSIDAAGNKEEAKAAIVKIDKTKPTTTIDVSETWVKDNVTVTLNATDGDSGVAETYYSINGSNYQEGTSFVVEGEGVNEIAYYSVDTAGNREAINIKKAKIDKTAPTVSSSLEDEYELGSTITLDYLAEDKLSGITAEEVSLNGQSYKKGDEITLNQLGDYKLVIKATDAAGWTTTVEKSYVVYIPVTLEVLPKVIKENKGTFTVKATLPTNYQNESFDPSSLTLNGVSPILSNKGLQKQAEKGLLKFDREDFDWTAGGQPLELRGTIDGKYLVVGKTVVEVKGKEKPESCWFPFFLLQWIDDFLDYSKHN